EPPCDFYVAADTSIVVEYTCTDKAIKIHTSQWQTLIDTIGPIFDFCYPYRVYPERPEENDENDNETPIPELLGFNGYECISPFEYWDHDEIQAAIRNGEQYELARQFEECNPTVYRVGSHDCAATVFVPDVKVVDNCSGV